MEVVQIFLFNKRGEIILQKRSNDKAHNPGLLDKSIGGHVSAGDTIVYTCMVETIQELQIPSIVTENKNDFQKTYTLLENYLDTICVLKHIESIFVELPKIINNEKIMIGNKAHIYFGIYDGKIRFADAEARGINFYTFQELENEIQKNPNQFTQDILFFVNKYKKELSDFVLEIKNS